MSPVRLRTLAALLTSLLCAAEQPSIQLLAGHPTQVGRIDGPARQARFKNPCSITLSSRGLFIADANNSVIRGVAPTVGYVYTFAGTTARSGIADGRGSEARFTLPVAICSDANDDLWVADHTVHGGTIRKIDRFGKVTTIAGSPTKSGSVDGPGALATFTMPEALVSDGRGGVFIADCGGANTIRHLKADGSVTTVAGTPGRSGNQDGLNALFNCPMGLAFDSSTGTLYIADTYNHTIRKRSSDGTVTTIAGRAGVAGETDGAGDSASFNLPRALWLSQGGDLFVVDAIGFTLRRVSPNGVVTTIAGSPGKALPFEGDLPGTLYYPFAATGDPKTGTMYLLAGNSVIRLTGLR